MRGVWWIAYYEVIILPSVVTEIIRLGRGGREGGWVRSMIRVIVIVTYFLDFFSSINHRTAIIGAVRRTLYTPAARDRLPG